MSRDSAELRALLATHNIARSTDPSWQWSKTAIPEFGHAAGLGHRQDRGSAMMSGDAALLNITPFFDAHDISSISANY